MIIRLIDGPLKTKFGDFHEYLYYDGQSESIALVMGDVSGQEKVLCRVHSHCISAHIFNSVECDCREQMEMAQKMILNEGSGVIIWLDQEARGNGHFALLASAKMRHDGDSQTNAYAELGFEVDARSYRRASEILNDLGVKSTLLMSNNPKKMEQLKQDGVNVIGLKEVSIKPNNELLQRTYDDKLERGHTISSVD